MILGVVQQQMMNISITPDPVDWSNIVTINGTNAATITGINTPITLKFTENFAGAGGLTASVNVNSSGWVSIVHNDEFSVSNNQTVEFRLDGGVSRREYFSSIYNMTDSGTLLDDFTLAVP